MKIRYMGIILVVFFLAIAAASATSENITSDDTALSVSQDALVSQDNISVGSDSLGALSDNVSAADDNLGALSKNVSESDDCLAVSSENITLASSNDVPLSVSVESELSTPADQSKLSLATNQEDSKLTSIYDKVYSTKKWKTVWIVTITLKYKWSNKKMKQVANKKTKSVKSKVKRIIKQNLKKGWTYDGVYYTEHYGKYQCKYRYYLQFYKTVYYNGYGKVLYVE